MDLDLDDELDSESDDIDLSEDEQSNDTGNSKEETLYQRVKELCGGPDLMEVFGPSGSAKSTFAFEVLNSAIEEHGLNALVIDTERNVLEPETIPGADYVYVPEWHDLYSYIVKQPSKLTSDSFGDNTTGSQTINDGYDIVLLDSIGFPALVQYGEYRVGDNGDQFKIFNELQVIVGKLKQYSQRNEALVMVTNQPKSDLSDQQDPSPFGDKADYGFKEIWKTQKKSSNEVATKCDINAFRSRRRGKGSTVFSVKIGGEGVDVEYQEQGDTDQWM